MNMNNIGAIVQKDFKEFFNNWSLIVLPILPIFIAWMYQRTGAMTDEEMPIEMVYTVVAMALGGVLLVSIATMFAEENEKNTLRGLLQSPASIIDIITGKVLISLIITIVSALIGLFIIDALDVFKIVDLLGILMLVIFVASLGIAIGLLSKSVASVSAYIMPVMFFIAFSPMLDLFWNPENELIQTVIKYLPVNALIHMHHDFDVTYLVGLGIWMIVGVVIAVVVVNRAKKDE